MYIHLVPCYTPPLSLGANFYNEFRFSLFSFNLRFTTTPPTLTRSSVHYRILVTSASSTSSPRTMCILRRSRAMQTAWTLTEHSHQTLQSGYLSLHDQSLGNHRSQFSLRFLTFPNVNWPQKGIHAIFESPYAVCTHTGSVEWLQICSSLTYLHLSGMLYQ